MATNARRDPPFSKIAYNNLGNDLVIVSRLNREMETWMRSKKGVDELIGRIQHVTGMSYNQAKRVAQTERTRVQGQARYEAITAENKQRRTKKQHAAKKEWVHRNAAKEPRKTHAAMSGDIVRANEYFQTPDGNRLLYPGDPNAPASETINCHCYIRKA